MCEKFERKRREKQEEGSKKESSPRRGSNHGQKAHVRVCWAVTKPLLGFLDILGLTVLTTAPHPQLEIIVTILKIAPFP